jgi:membrane-bound lytic murein transglycosylase MltF
MLERRIIRFLVVHNPIFYFLDGATQRGSAYELGVEFEKFLNERFKKGTLKAHVVFVPVTRDRLLDALVKGEGDIAAANLTITPERRKIVEFSDPFLTGVDEIVVTAADQPPLSSAEDLSGRTVHVRRSSSYFESLAALNARLREAGRAEVRLVEANEALEDSDLLEMLEAGILPAVVVDSHKAEFWAQIFQNIRLHPGASVRKGGEIAWAFRQGSPELKKAVDEFVRGHKKGTLMGNVLFKRYLQSTRYVRNPLRNEEYLRFAKAVEFFRTYADRYDFDWLLVAAQAYQESRIDQSMRSPVGAIGVMQILPTTAADPSVGIPNIDRMEDNIHAGVKYLRFLRDTCLGEEPSDPMERALLALASYNAGPARVAGLRKKAAAMGFDPNRWFGNVEVVAAREVGRETVQYVSSIFKYFIAYKLVADQQALRDEARQQAESQ